MNAVEQASIIYPILVKKSCDGAVATYGEINAELGYQKNANGNAIRPGLHLIVLYCRENGLPQLTSLVVNKNNGLPTEGYACGEGENAPEEHQKCFMQKWKGDFDYSGIWDRRFELRKKYNLTYGKSQLKKSTSDMVESQSEVSIGIKLKSLFYELFLN